MNTYHVRLEPTSVEQPYGEVAIASVEAEDEKVAGQIAAERHAPYKVVSIEEVAGD